MQAKYRFYHISDTSYGDRAVTEGSYNEVASNILQASSCFSIGKSNLSLTVAYVTTSSSSSNMGERDELASDTPTSTLTTSTSIELDITRSGFTARFDINGWSMINGNTCLEFLRQLHDPHDLSHHEPQGADTWLPSLEERARLEHSFLNGKLSQCTQPTPFVFSWETQETKKNRLNKKERKKKIIN